MPDGWEDYLRAHYAETKNEALLAELGMPPNAYRTMRRLASSLGLKKSAAFMAACQREGVSKARDVLRGVGNAGRKNLELGARYRYKPGETCVQRLGEEGERRRLAKSHATRNETIRKERMRIRWGLEQRTRMKLVSEDRRATTLRHNLKVHGYEIPCRGSKTIYYTNHTRRSALMETHAAKLGLTILPL